MRVNSLFAFAAPSFRCLIIYRSALARFVWIRLIRVRLLTLRASQEIFVRFWVQRPFLSLRAVLVEKTETDLLILFVYVLVEKTETDLLISLSVYGGLRENCHLSSAIIFWKMVGREMIYLILNNVKKKSNAKIRYTKNVKIFSTHIFWLKYNVKKSDYLLLLINLVLSRCIARKKNWNCFSVFTPKNYVSISVSVFSGLHIPICEGEMKYTKIFSIYIYIIFLCPFLGVAHRKNWNWFTDFFEP